MSADNWAKCPQCQEDLRLEREKNFETLEGQYGKIPKLEYDKALAILTDQNTTEITSSLREDYEIGIWDEEFFVSYKGRCDNCGFSYEFKTKEKLKLK
jgi:predicted Zn-ribbon and HTH transcriptional regulator